MNLKICTAAALCGVVVCGSSVSQAAHQARGRESRGQVQTLDAGFVPAQLVAAWPIEYPIRSVAAGVVVLEIAIDDNGKVVDAIARRDIPSLTGAAVQGVKKWEYKAAMREGEPVWSRATVAVMFNPTIASAAVELSPETTEFETPRHRYPPDPAELVSVYPAVYPTAYIGIDLSAVFSVTLGADGSIGDVKTIHGEKPLVEVSQTALKKWQFKPARYDGKTISAPVAVAFVFPVPVTN